MLSREQQSDRPVMRRLTESVHLTDRAIFWINAKSCAQPQIALPRVLALREGEVNAEPNACQSAGCMTARREPRPPRRDQRAPARCSLSRQEWPPPTAGPRNASTIAALRGQHASSHHAIHFALSRFFELCGCTIVSSRQLPANAPTAPTTDATMIAAGSPDSSRLAAPVPPPQSTAHASRSDSVFPPAACSSRLPSTQPGTPQISEYPAPVAKHCRLSLNQSQPVLSDWKIRPIRQAKQPPAAQIPSSVPKTNAANTSDQRRPPFLWLHRLPCYFLQSFRLIEADEESGSDAWVSGGHTCCFATYRRADR